MSFSIFRARILKPLFFIFIFPWNKRDKGNLCPSNFWQIDLWRGKPSSRRTQMLCSFFATQQINTIPLSPPFPGECRLPLCPHAADWGCTALSSRAAFRGGNECNDSCPAQEGKVYAGLDCPGCRQDAAGPYQLILAPWALGQLAGPS